MRSRDVLELLLPEAPPATLGRARRVTTFLRLLSSDATPAPAGSVRVNLERARCELERDGRAHLGRALRDLLRHHLAAALGPDSFADAGRPRLGVQEAWGRLDEVRADCAGVPAVPAPDEDARFVAARLLEWGRRRELLEGELPLWEARLRRAQDGPRSAERAFRALLGASATRGGPALAGLVESLLDRGAVAAAAVALDENAACARGDARVARLRSWVALLRGEAAGDDPRDDPRATLPAPLVELRERRPEWLPRLAGRRAAAPRGARALEPEDAAPRRCDRTEVGAVLLGVFALCEGGAVRALALDVAAALRPRLDDWLAERDGALAAAGEPERALVARPGPVVRHRLADAPLRGTLSPASRAVALAPIVDGVGEVAGWLRAEWEHHLVPSAARLARLAAAWRADVLEARARDEAGDERPAAREAAGLRAAPEPADPRGRVFRALVDGLGIKTGQRGWWGFDVAAGRATLVARGGSLGRGAPDAGAAQARCLARALRTRAAVRYDGESAGVALHREASAGLVVPLVRGAAVLGLLCLESTRRNDLGEALERRLVQRATEHVDALVVARFRAWHLERYGFDVHFDPTFEACADLYRDVLAAARARAPLAVIGPPGCGKQVLARWVHFQSGGRRVLRVLPCRFRPADRPLFADAGERDACRTLLLDGLDRLPRRHQRALLERLAGRSADGPRLVATMQAAPADADAAARLLPDLARHFERLQLRVPPLARRRDEVPALAAVLLERFAREECAAAPVLDDTAVAALWRQPWEGNLRELENLIYQLVVHHAGQAVDGADLERLCRRLHVSLLQRIPSRRPEAEWIRAALRATRTGRGSINKTRASLYLGWDPDTLVTRMKELGLEPADAARDTP